MLSSALAQQIANDITDVIIHNVLITDSEGIVLGSGDQLRVGQFHEASVEVIRSRKMITHNAEDVRQLVGSLPGVTIPLVIDGNVVGTIGLSGPPSQVEQFGLVVKRQTEILMQEAARIGSRRTRERAIEELLRDIADWHHSTLGTGPIERRATTLGFDLESPRVVALIGYSHSGSHVPSDAGPDKVVNALASIFTSRTDLIAPLARSMIAVATRVDAVSPASDHTVMAACSTFITLARELGWSIRIGLGSRATGIEQLNISARDAYDAIQLGSKLEPSSRFHDIERFRLQQAVSVIPDESRLRLAQTILRGLPLQDDWPMLANTVIAWGESAFNSTAAAQRLHIHRNTLTYRLEKIERAIDRSLGDPGTAISLYLACTMTR
ncbi:UNVERIFIED_ORG: carbohydrate diacid regulator [Nocardia globerula]|uniref:Carbohydrate diacid regulator n=1 Tax=Nocardia globerula TaxID=1818 RepID=A0A652YR29_NOCGL|nr:sugar diacid recognition domain-containing protein [Rhodococcus globerulus]NMD63410.1 sugar diacid utilization regulator [Nocardia globerula]PVX62974.1 carbohydrate diacid regulator [Rhodococcus globerulus]